jgi:hypothetical protein
LEEKSLLNTVMNNIKGGHGPKDNATNITSQLYAETYFHEYMHLSPLVNRTDYYDVETGFDETQGPAACQNLARWAGCKARLTNYKNCIYVSSMYNGRLQFLSFFTPFYHTPVGYTKPNSLQLIVSRSLP